MKFDEQQLRDRGFVKNSAGDWEKPKRTVPTVREEARPEPERVAAHAPPQPPPREAVYSGRVLVCVTSYRCGTQLDEDNICPKYFVDCLRYAGLIHSDAPGAVKLRVEEKRVPTKKEEGCEIVITPL